MSQENTVKNKTKDGKEYGIHFNSLIYQECLLLEELIMEVKELRKVMKPKK